MSAQTTPVAVPQTTEYTVVFPAIDFESKFDSSFYAPNLTDGRASVQEITQVLSDLESTRKPFVKQIRRAGCLIVSYSVLSFLAFLYFLLTMDAGSGGMIIAAIIAFFIGIIASLVILILYLKGVDAKMKPKCQETIDRHNQNFLPRGLRWHLPANFPKWIELWKDYYQPQGVRNQPIGVPQFGQNYPYQQQGQSDQGQNMYRPPFQC